MNKAAFFDRDGTINVNTGYLYEIEKFKFIEGIPELIKKYNNDGYKVIVITNQAGIAKRYYTEEDMHKLHRHINFELEKIGAKIDAFYFCPHHPDFTGECNCRKPKTGMVEQAILEFNINVKESVFYGDKASDMEVARKCGIKGVLV